MKNPPPVLTDGVLNEESAAGDGVVGEKTERYDASARRDSDGTIKLRAIAFDCVRLVSKARIFKVKDLKDNKIYEVQGLHASFYHS